ncbi:hypothetical protein FDP41_009811 [Naegleria fowleri]|uniref:RGS domain-containing protein n=1 Tax=Naegleria fowleri TaxID=5763 RepID=A0A6A5BDD2_NAEFO|nr:uncharacterized protein FDP41_009811 [Naegleria fowleri]KAF0972115.1 hypothetical protein FDP41_009811 [Naegleria fowleri]
MLLYSVASTSHDDFMMSPSSSSSPTKMNPRRQTFSSSHPHHQRASITSTSTTITSSLCHPHTLDHDDASLPPPTINTNVNKKRFSRRFKQPLLFHETHRASETSFDSFTQMIGEALKDCSHVDFSLFENSSSPADVNNVQRVNSLSPTMTGNVTTNGNTLGQNSPEKQHPPVVSSTSCPSSSTQQHVQDLKHANSPSSPQKIKQKSPTCDHASTQTSSSRFKLSRLLKNSFDLFISKENFTSHGDDFDIQKPPLKNKTIPHTKSAPELSRPLPTTTTATSLPISSCNNESSNVSSSLQPSTTNEMTMLSLSTIDASSPQECTLSQNNNVSSIVKSYYSVETILEHPDGRELLREFMKKRCNEELFLYLEVVRAFEKIIKQSQSYRAMMDSTPPISTMFTSTTVVLTEEFLKLKEFKLIYDQFISLKSPHCMNIDHALRDRIESVYKQLLEKVNHDAAGDYHDSKQTISPNPNQQPHLGRNEMLIQTIHACSMFDKISESLNLLRVTIELQFKDEIFPQFKKTKEFQNLILSKMIE